MDPDRWETIQAAFDELVALDETSRASQLAALRDSDPELKAAVEAMLAADAEASGQLAPLDSGLLGAAEPIADPLNLAGRSVSHFDVHEPLGAGGMGVVYRARDTRLGRDVALKFLLPHYSLDAAAKARFLREARAAAALDHPHLCTIYDVRESEEGRLFLAMALYAGETLKARLARDGPLPLAEALSITKQIARGLACAHAAGIVHRDLKPGNVMLLPDGTVKILDFGLAKALDETTGETDARFGTVAYMAPEQIQGETADKRTDLWAVGVVLFEMLTGRKPFEGEHEVAIAHAIVHKEPVPPSHVRKGLPASVEDVVLALLQKDPGARPAAVDELIADLDAVGPLDASPARGARTRRTRTTRVRLRERRWMVTLAVGLVIGGIGGTAIARWPRTASPLSVSRYSVALPDAEALAVAQNQYFQVALSRDGEHLVYMGLSPDGGYQLWLRRRDQLHATPLAGTVGAANPFFSPDGSRVGFVTTTGGPRALKVISLGGGPPTTVTDSLVDNGGAAWGDDGYIYFDAQGPAIARVRETGGAPELVTIKDSASGEAWHYQPEPLPGGRGVLFVIRRNDMRESDIAVVDLASGVHRVLLRGITPRFAASGHLVYATVSGTLMAVPFDPDKLVLAGRAVVLAGGLRVQTPGWVDLAISNRGTLIYAAGGPTAGQDELVWVTRDGRTTPIDTAWRTDFGSLALSPDGAALAVGVADAGEFEVWIKRLGLGAASKIGDGGAHPTWTPDGRAVAFVATTAGAGMKLDLFLRRSDGSAPRRLIREEPNQVWEAQYSQDGKWLVYRTASDLFAVRTDGDTSRIPLVVTPFAEYTPSLSPDGRWFAYSSDESGTREVYVRPFPNTGTARWQISIAGGSEPVWSRNGRELFYKNGRQELVAVAVPRTATFTMGEQRVLFSTAGYDVSLEGEKTYDVSPDGSRFVMIRLARKSHDQLIVVENFFEELRSRVGSAPRAHASR